MVGHVEAGGDHLSFNLDGNRVPVNVNQTVEQAETTIFRVSECEHYVVLVMVNTC